MVQGFNSVSLDIEGVAQPDNGKPLFTGKALNVVLSAWGKGKVVEKLKTKNDSGYRPGLTRCITIPGNGVKAEFGGMKWLVDVDPKNYEYLILMYYGLGADTDATDGSGGGGYESIIESLSGWIKGGGPIINGQTPWTNMPAIDSSKIIIGFSFGTDTKNVKKYIDLYSAFSLGGVTRWVYRPKVCNPIACTDDKDAKTCEAEGANGEAGGNCGVVTKTCDKGGCFTPARVPWSIPGVNNGVCGTCPCSSVGCSKQSGMTSGSCPNIFT